jgi:hypothetical protein
LSCGEVKVSGFAIANTVHYCSICKVCRNYELFNLICIGVEHFVRQTA